MYGWYTYNLFFDKIVFQILYTFDYLLTSKKLKNPNILLNYNKKVDYLEYLEYLVLHTMDRIIVLLFALQAQACWEVNFNTAWTLPVITNTCWNATASITVNVTCSVTTSHITSGSITSAREVTTSVVQNSLTTFYGPLISGSPSNINSDSLCKTLDRCKLCYDTNGCGWCNNECRSTDICPISDCSKLSESPVLWGIVGAVLAIIGIVVAVILWYRKPEDDKYVFGHIEMKKRSNP